jgi:hypothetical protein
MYKNWMDLVLRSALLCRDAQEVIGLRMMKLANGRGGEREARLMMTEKAFAAVEAFGTIAYGGSPEKVVRGYRKVVSANKRRLSRRSARSR